MAEIFNDNFESGAFAAWTSDANVVAATGVTGMQGTYCAELSLDDSQLLLTLSPAEAEVYVALDVNFINQTGGYGGVIVFKAGATVLGMLYAAGSGDTPIQVKLEAWKGYFGTKVGIHDVFLDAGTKYHIEVRYLPHATTGIFQVKLDDVLVIDFAGQTAVSTTDVDTVRLGEISGDSMYMYADRVSMDDAAWPATYEAGSPPALAITGFVPIKISLDGVIGPTFIGVNIAVVGSVALQVDPTAVITLANPLALEVVGSIGIRVSPVGIISELAPLIRACIGSVKLGIGIAGVVAGAAPVVPPSLAITGSVGIGINATGVVGGITPLTLAVIGSVEIRIGEFRVPELTVVQLLSPAAQTLAIIGSVGMEVGPVGVITLSSPPPTYAVPTPRPVDAPTINIRVAGVIAFIHPQILEVIGDIEVDVGVGGGAVDPGVFATYALTGIRGEPSIYSNFPFNSYASYRGQDFGAGPDGIYLLEGSDDDGETIHSGVKIGPVNFSTDREKRLRLLRLGGKTTGAQVKVSNGNGSAGYYDVVDGRAGVSREVQAREITIDITDFESLDHLEIVPLILSKR